MADRRIREKRRMLRWCAAFTGLLTIGLACSAIVGSALEASPTLLRTTMFFAPAAHTVAGPLVLTLGGPVYCAQTAPLARRLGATLVCPDYGQNGERSAATRARRVEDWGDPRYLDAVARLPAQLAEEGVRVSELVLVGASYAGYAAAELVATHPELHPRALIIVDSFLDLPERFRALGAGQPTRAEMVRVLGGTLAQRPGLYGRRSPSAHLAGLAADIRHGMRLLDVWSVAPAEAHEFNGGMCSMRSNAFWLHQLAQILRRPVTGYVTELPHAVALWDWWRQLLALARVAPANGALPATAITFRPKQQIPKGSYCRMGGMLSRR